MRQGAPESPGFRHEALFYVDDDELLAGVLPAIRDAVVRGAGVLIALPRQPARVLREGLGPMAHHVAFADAEEIGRNPGRLIPGWRDFVHANTRNGGPPLGIAEPVWEGRSAAEIVECARHETLLNIAFDDGPEWRLICTYNVAGLEPDVLAHARRTHPHLVEHGEAAAHEFQREIPGDEPLPEPAGEPEELRFRLGDLVRVRDFTTTRATAAGMSPRRVADLVLAVDELATNTLRYTSSGGVLRMWREGGSLLCDVADKGHIADPLVGRELPAPDQPGGRGLWLVNQLCDLVQLRSSPGRSVVRVHMRVGAS
jgi:anti-sigma regulatory factor (Ser/Thr protein kinase)